MVRSPASPPTPHPNPSEPPFPSDPPSPTLVPALGAPSTGALLLLTAFAILAFAGNSVLTRAALAEPVIGAEPFAAIRLLSGALTLAAIVAWRGGAVRPGRADAIGITSLFAYAIAFSLAYRGLTTATGALILFALVQVTLVAASAATGRWPNRTEALGIAIALSGLAWLLAPGVAAPPPGPALLMVVAGIAWGLYTWAGRGTGDALARTARNFLGTLPLAAITMLAAIALDPHALLGLGATGKDDPGTHAIAVGGIALAVASGAIASGLGYAAWYRVLPRLSATSAGLLQLLVPVVAAFGGAVWLGEAPTLRLVLAALLIVAGIALGLLGGRR